MSRSRLNFWLDVVSLLVMLGLAITGCVMRYVLPAGTGHTRALLGLGRHDYGTIHFYLSLAVVLLLVLHVALHWAWVCCVAARGVGAGQPGSRSRTAAGATLLGACLLLLGGTIWWAPVLVTSPPRPLSPGRAGDAAGGRAAAPGTLHRTEEDCPLGLAVTGRTTVREAAEAAGLTVPALLEELGAPAGLDPEERLGPLKRELGLSIHEVRRIVCRPR